MHGSFKKIRTGLLKNPLNLLKRVIFKTITGPLKYGKDKDYDAAKYWHDRFSKYGCSYQGAGDESISNDENKERYRKAERDFKQILQNENIDFTKINVLEIGVGGALFTNILSNMGVQNVTGIDITDVLFEQHKEKFPGYTFIKRDITTDSVEGTYELITMIDVVQHIVDKDKAVAAMENIKRCMNDGSMFFIAPLVSEDQRHLFYVHVWSVNTIKELFSEYEVSNPLRFKGNYALLIRKSGKV